MMFNCKKCGTPNTVKNPISVKGGSTTGPTKARDSQKMRDAANVKWNKWRMKRANVTAIKKG